MTYDQWIETYKPVQNDIVEHAGMEGTMFETYGDEVKHVWEARGQNVVWTLCDEDGETYIVSGFWRINRLGYFITEIPFEGEYGDIQIIF